MHFWVFAAFLLLLLAVGALALRRRKLRRKQRVLQRIKRPPVQPAPFALRDFDTAPTARSQADTETFEAVAAFKVYCTVYARLLAGEPASAIPDYPGFVQDPPAPGPGDDDLGRFIRTAFHSDVLFGYLSAEFENTLATSLRIGMAQHWRAAPLGEAALLAFRRTGELRYLAAFRQFFDRLMMLRDTELGYHDDYHDRVMNAWGAYNVGKNAGKPGLWVAHVTHFAVCMLPATGFAREVLSNPALADHRDWATSVIGFFDEGYRQFDTDYRAVEGIPEKWYWRPLLDKYEAINHMHLLGQALLNVHAITGNPDYADRIQSFLRVFSQGVTLHADGLASWKYSPYFQVADEKNGHISRQYSEYSWKGEITVPFLYEAKAAGFDISQDILDGVTSSIRDHILKDADYKLHVHPAKSRPIRPRDRKKAGSIEAGVSGYHAAASEDPRIEQQVIDVVAASPALFPKGWMSQPRLARSYARLLEEKR